MADPYPLQVQKGNRMKFDTQLKTPLSSSPTRVHLFHIDKSCEISIITRQLPSISNFTKIGQKPDMPITFDLITSFKNRPLDKLYETTRS